jgi:hypothetical protein
MSQISVDENRYVELLEKERKLDAIVSAYPEIEDGQKLTSAAKRYKAAFSKFVDRVDQVLSSDQIKGIFQIAYVHGFKYKGESLAQDILDAKKLLK